MISDLPVEILCNILKYTDIKTISKMMCINKNFRNFIKYHKWYLISQLPYFKLINKTRELLLLPKTKETFYEYESLINFRFICYNFKIPEIIIPLFHDKLDMFILVKKQRLSNEFLKKHYSLFDLSDLFIHQIIDNDLLEDIIYNNKISSADWTIICLHQKLSFKFIKDFEFFIDWESLSLNKESLTHEVLSYYNNKLNWNSIHSNIHWLY